MQFPLDFDHMEGLYPRTLRNDRNQPCTIQIVFRSETDPITLPPHGFLRVVFGDPACKRLLSVKGCISLNGSDTRNAVVQRPGPKQPALFLYHKQYRDLFPLETGGAFLDAAADGRGGAVVLTNHGLYDTATGETEREDRRPIRVYGAGTLWVVQYADGTLRCNLHKKGGQPIERAVAVVENADRSLMLKDEDGFWDCAGGVAKAISEDAFVHCMMDRFLSSDVCESVTGVLMQLTIRRNGEFEAM